METSLLSNFFAAIQSDPRIGPMHISLYAAMVQLYISRGFHEPVIFKRPELMALAKITGPTTYHRILSELIENGYVRYEPRFDRKGSLIYLGQKNNECVARE